MESMVSLLFMMEAATHPVLLINREWEDPVPLINTSALACLEREETSMEKNNKKKGNTIMINRKKHLKD